MRGMTVTCFCCRTITRCALPACLRQPACARLHAAECTLLHATVLFTSSVNLFLLQHDLAKVLIPKGLVLDRVAKLADDIRRCYGPKTIHLICVLKVRNVGRASVVSRSRAAHAQRHVQGGHQFFSDLIQCLKQQHVLHDTNYVPFSFDFIRVKSYEGTASSGSGAWHAARTCARALTHAPYPPCVPAEQCKSLAAWSRCAGAMCCWWRTLSTRG